MKTIRNLIITLLIGAIAYYLTLPALNLHSISFYVYVCSLILIFTLLCNVNNKDLVLFLNGKKVKGGNNSFAYAILGIVGLFIVIMVVNFICSPIFNAKSYQTRISVNENGNFLEDIPEVNFNQLPLLDKKSSQVLGDRVMGQMSDLVSQFAVSSLYTQINYKDDIVRVTPLEYADGIKWLTNRKEGIPGYIIVNSVTGESELVRMNKGMKYVSSGMFNDNLDRKLRFSYPTLNFGKISFEIDNEGNPYYIIPTISYTAVGLKAKVNGVIILDPVTGESKRYSLKKVPKWVDIAYSASLIIEQVNDWGTYKNGYWNSIFGQKNVVNTTEGYNYLAMNDDIYLYTGITSVVSDESNLGFILTNMRTSETTYYAVAGAEEYSAMNSARGQVQDMGYDSTFPLLINLNGKPTYLVSLKDSSGLVKMYGFIDVKDYQKVVVTDSSKGIIVAKDNYLERTKTKKNDDDLKQEEIKVKTINTAIINGYTYYYIGTEDKKFKVSISLSDNLPYLNVGDTIKVGYTETDKEIIEVEKVFK